MKTKSFKMTKAELKRIEGVFALADIEIPKANNGHWFSMRVGAVSNRVCHLIKDRARRGMITGPVGWKTRFCHLLKVLYETEMLTRVDPSKLNDHGRKSRLERIAAKLDFDRNVYNPDHNDLGEYGEAMFGMICVKLGRVVTIRHRQDFYDLVINKAGLKSPLSANELYQRDLQRYQETQKAHLETMQKATAAIRVLARHEGEFPEGAQVVTDGQVASLVVDGTVIGSWMDLKPGSNAVN